MGTKANPSKFDCYEKANEDEPMFVLLARDPLAPMVIEEWIRWEENRLGQPTPKTEEAKECVTAMRKWRLDNATGKN